MESLKQTLDFPAGERRSLHVLVQADDAAAVARALDGGADVDARDRRRRTPLHLAAFHGTTAIAFVLMNKGADLDARDMDAWTPLLICCQKESTEIATMLVERGVNLEATTKKGSTPLQICAQYGSTEIAEMLMERGVDLEAKEADGFASLHACAYGGSTDIAKMLVARGADLEAKSNDGFTPLHVCSQNGTTEIAKMLVDRNVDLEAKQNQGWAPLHLCAQCGSTEIAKMLMERGVDLEGKVNQGWTPLHLCAQNGTTEIARMLMERGVDLESKTDDADASPLHICSHHNTTEIALMLMEGGVDLEAKDDEGSTALHVCSLSGTTEIAKMLIERGVDMEAKDNEGWTALHACSQNGTTEIAMMLMERGVDLETKTDVGGWTPLLVCSHHNTTEIAMMLIERGVDLEARDSQNFTPMHVCSREGTLEIAKLMIERGADVNSFTHECKRPLHIAAASGQIIILEELLKHGAWMNSQDVDGFSALHCAVGGNQGEAVLSLLARTLGDLVNLKDTNGSTALHIATREKFESIARALVDAGAGVHIKDNAGKTPLDYVSPEQETMLAILVAHTETPIPCSSPPSENPAERIPDEFVHDSKTSLTTAASHVVSETKADEKVSSVSAHDEDLQGAEEVDVNPSELTAVEPAEAQGDTEDFSSSLSSESGEWIPDEPFGSRGRLLKAIDALKPGQVFADDYTISEGNFGQKLHLRSAEYRFKKQSVVLKFYWDEEAFEKTIDVHSMLVHSEHVCSIFQPLRTSKTGHPPCIVFEKGSQTLREWLQQSRSIFDRKWCLHQVLTGLKDIHAEGIVHTDLKLSNAMFFHESMAWKLIDFDRAQKDGQSRAICFTTPYAAPEVLREWQDVGELPAAQPSSDLWSFGILAFEVLTGLKMFEEDFTEDDIFEFVLDGKVEERLDLIEDELHREAVSNFLKFNPAERWSANRALQDVTFQSDPNTTTTQI